MPNSKPISKTKTVNKRGIIAVYGLVEAFRELKPEMPMQMASVFLTIAMKPGIYQADLANLSGLSQSSVSRNVTALTAKDRHGAPGLGLVVRRIGDRGGKTAALHLTKAGKELASKLSGLGQA
jgi:DNA-binding MarR family transcriptional regulator